MTEREALLAAILATPEDDLPRLVYADWCDEHGEGERAEFIRTRSPKIPSRYFLTKYGRFILNEVRPYLAGIVPKSWSLWLRRDPEFYPTFDNKKVLESWWASCGECHFSASGKPFVVAFRHGFVDAVAMDLRQMAKTLPALCRAVPITRACVIGHFFGGSWYIEPSPVFVIRQGWDPIPAGVWDRLTPPNFERYGHNHKLYPNAASLHEDLGRSFLAWAKSQQ